MPTAPKPQVRWTHRAAQLRTQGWARLRGGQLTPTRLAGSVALGLFIGSLPLYGLHLPLCLSVCLPLRLDTPVAYLAANISNPLIAPWLMVLEVQLGSRLLTGGWVPFDVHAAKTVGVGAFVGSAAVGSVLVGAALALLGAAVSGSVALWMKARRDLRRSSALQFAKDKPCISATENESDRELGQPTL